VSENLIAGTNGETQAARVCVSCNAGGHWYLHCPKFDFVGSIWDAFALWPKPWTHPSDGRGAEPVEVPCGSKS
jgi:hypothetical protein